MATISPSDLCVWCRRGAMLDGICARLYVLDGTSICVCDVHLGVMVAAAIVDREVTEKQRQLNWAFVLGLPEGARS